MDDDKKSNMICIPCKDQLSQFYILKQQALKHLKPSDIRKQQIVENIVGFLDQTLADCIVSKFSNLLAIHTESNNPLVMEQLENCNVMLSTEPTQLKIDDECVTYSIEEELKFEEIEKSDYHETELYLVDDQKKQEYLQPEVSSPDPPLKEFEVASKNSPKKKYRKSNLDPKQKEWMKKEISQSAILFETSFGNKLQYTCSKCSFKSFASENSFRIHLKTHLDHKEEAAETINQLVRKEISSEEQLIIEQKLWINHQIATRKEQVVTKDGIKSVWSCSLCNFTSQKRGRFRSHLQKNHSNIVWRGPSKYSCYECHLRFDGDNHLEVHKNCHRIFEVLAPYSLYPECEGCKMFFATINDLELHHERHNNCPETLREPILAEGVVHKNGEIFSNEEEDRLEIHDEDAPTCGHCLAKFSTENECKNHLMLFHVSTFTCPFDSRVFDGIPTLSLGNHLRQCHPDIFPELQISCKLCKKQFETVYEKLAHMKKCEAKLFQCDHCDKTFGKKTNLLHHIKVAMGLMVFAW
jgi:Zinc finger, C2H2 type